MRKLRSDCQGLPADGRLRCLYYDVAGEGCRIPFPDGRNPLGCGEPLASSARGRRRAGGLVGDRRAQVVERPVRLRLPLLRGSCRPSRCDVGEGQLPDPVGGRPGAGSDGLGPGVLEAGEELSRLRRDPLVGPLGHRRDGRALLRPCTPTLPRPCRESLEWRCRTRSS